MMINKLEVQHLSYAYYDEDVISDIDLYVAENEFVGLVGPNGCGKSTILKNIYGSLHTNRGRILLDDEPICHMNAKQIARKMAVVGQENEFDFDFSVNEMVAMGRSPHKKLFDPDTKEDEDIIMEALQRVGMLSMIDRKYSTLSGGEKQRVLIARAIAQKTDFFILDEPTNHLDISFQLQVCEIVRGLGVTVLTAMHDLNLAALFCDRIYVIKEHAVYRFGTAEEILTPQLIKEVFGVTADVKIHPVTKKPNIIFIPDLS
ncbi:ABC transporter ATP-binding protein [uncultured Methanocorpusculum sp.]|nr:ABC transporter ATP-binding protein [uncultured Methanocorpusculum sp.]